MMRECDLEQFPDKVVWHSGDGATADEDMQAWEDNYTVEMGSVARTSNEPEKVAPVLNALRSGSFQARHSSKGCTQATNKADTWRKSLISLKLRRTNYVW